MGTGSRSQYRIGERLTAYHDERPFEVIVTLGDDIYPSGDPSDLPAKFERPYAELLRREVRFYASLGNHDVVRGRQSLVHYRHLNMGGRSYYSFTKGNDLVEFFALDSTAPDAAQRQWLEDALSDSRARWKIAYFHHPLYSSGLRHGSTVKLRAQWEPLFVRYGVDAVISGHDHFYERTKPQQGVYYFVSGAGGQLRQNNINRDSPFFAAGNDQANSFIYFEVNEDVLSFWAVDADGRILDSGVLLPSQRLNPDQ
jgi:3',5'-cyclic AMP phosphodiesterase CpdA